MIPQPREENGYLIIDFHKCGWEYDKYFKGQEKPELIASIVKDGWIAYSIITKQDIKKQRSKKHLTELKKVKLKMAKYAVDDKISQSVG